LPAPYSRPGELLGGPRFRPRRHPTWRESPILLFRPHHCRATPRSSPRLSKRKPLRRLIRREFRENPKCDRIVLSITSMVIPRPVWAGIARTCPDPYTWWPIAANLLPFSTKTHITGMMGPANRRWCVRGPPIPRKCSPRTMSLRQNHAPVRTPPRPPRDPPQASFLCRFQGCLNDVAATAALPCGTNSEGFVGTFSKFCPKNRRFLPVRTSIRGRDDIAFPRGRP